MARRRRRAPARAGPATDAVNLFPFLSIFLCIMGVLAFLQVLMASMESRKIDLVGDVSQGYEVAFKLFCTPAGIIAVPPTAGLDALIAAAGDEAARRGLRAVLERRRAQRAALAAGAEPMGFVGPEDLEIEGLLAEIDGLNEAARAARHLREEFVLFGIYPGGGPAYRRVRAIMDGSPRYAGIRVGLEALDSNWQLVIDGAPVGGR